MCPPAISSIGSDGRTYWPCRSMWTLLEVTGGPVALVEGVRQSTNSPEPTVRRVGRRRAGLCPWFGDRRRCAHPRLGGPRRGVSQPVGLDGGSLRLGPRVARRDAPGPPSARRRQDSDVWVYDLLRDNFDAPDALMKRLTASHSGLLTDVRKRGISVGARGRGTVRWKAADGTGDVESSLPGGFRRSAVRLVDGWPAGLRNSMET